MKRTITLTNIKKHKNFSTDMEPGEMIAFVGKNKTGKSTVIQAIEASLKAKMDLVEPVSKGEEEGKIVYEGQEINSGQPIRVVISIDKDDNSTIAAYVTDDTGKSKKINSVKKIRELLGLYNPVTVNEAYSMMKSIESRRKFVNEYLLSFLSEKDQATIRGIDTSISSKKNKETEGNLYHQRSDIRSKIKNLEEFITSAMDINDTDKELLERANEAKKDYEELQVKKGQLQQEIENDKLRTELQSYVVNRFNEIANKLVQAGLYNKREDWIESFMENDPTIKKIFMYESQYDKNHEELTSLNERITRADTIMSRINLLENTKKQLDPKRAELRELREKEEGLTKTIEGYKERKQQIISKAPELKGIDIDEEYNIRFNDIPFDETSMSETEGRLFVMGLMVHTSKSDFVNIGDWSLYDSDSREEIEKIAKDRIVIGQMVTEDTEVETLVLTKE